MSNKPIHTIRHGEIKAAIWKNESQSGAFHNVTITRTYKDGDQFKDTTSFRSRDLLSVAQLATLADAYLNAKKSE